jgi:hypothetical protein
MQSDISDNVVQQPKHAKGIEADATRRSTCINVGFLDGLFLCGFLGVIFYFYGAVDLFVPGSRSAFSWLWHAWNRETSFIYARFYPFVLLFFVFRGVKDSSGVRKYTDWFGVPILLLGICLFVLSARLIQPRFAIIGLPLILLGGIMVIWGRKVAGHFTLPFLSLWLLIPLPMPTLFVIMWSDLVFEIINLVFSFSDIILRSAESSIIIIDSAGMGTEIPGVMKPGGLLQFAPVAAALYCVLLKMKAVKTVLLLCASPLCAFAGVTAKALMSVILLQYTFIDTTGKVYSIASFWLIFLPVTLGLLIAIHLFLNWTTHSVKTRFPNLSS